MIESYKDFWKKAFDFRGKTSRRDYWLYVLANTIIGFIFGFINVSSLYIDENIYFFITGCTYIYIFASMIPSWSISIRRLRDSGTRWQYIFIIFFPIAGAIYFVYLLCLPSSDSESDKAMDDEYSSSRVVRRNTSDKSEKYKGDSKEDIDRFIARSTSRALGIESSQPTKTDLAKPIKEVESLASKIRRKNIFLRDKGHFSFNEFATPPDTSAEEVFREFKALLTQTKEGQKIFDSLQVKSCELFNSYVGGLELVIYGNQDYVLTSRSNSDYIRWIIGKDILDPWKTKKNNLKGKQPQKNIINKTSKEPKKRNLPFEKLEYLRELFEKELINENIYKQSREIILGITEGKESSKDIKNKFANQLNSETKDKLLEIKSAYDEYLIDDEEYDHLIKNIFDF